LTTKREHQKEVTLNKNALSMAHLMEFLQAIQEHILVAHTEFSDDSFCESLPDEYPVYYGKDPFVGLYRPSENLLDCLHFVVLKTRDIAETYKNLDISNLGTPSVVFTLNQIQGLIEVFLKTQYGIDINNLLNSRLDIGKEESLTHVLGKGGCSKGQRDFFVAIKSQVAPF